MKITGFFAKTMSIAALSVMFAVPTLANSAPHEVFLTGKFLGNGANDTLLLVRGNGSGGNGGNGSGGNGSGSGNLDGSGDRDRDRDRNRDRDRDRDRDGSHLDNISAITKPAVRILAGNGKGSGNQDRDHDQNRDASCQG